MASKGTDSDLAWPERPKDVSGMQAVAASRYVCSVATDVEDARRLMQMLGLIESEEEQ